MLKIGITGGIGSGKSTVCKLFATLGIPIFYADEIGKLALNNQILIEQVTERFGVSVLNEQKQIDRKKIAAVVFNDTKKLELLNSIIHPYVAKEYHTWQQKQTTPYTIKEAAILFESNTYKELDTIISVISPLETRIARVMERSKLSRTEVEERIKNQITDEERIKKSDFFIYNNEQQSLIQQVLFLDKQLKEFANTHGRTR